MNWLTQTHRKIAWKDLEAIQNVCVEQVKKAPETGHLLISEPLPTFTYGRSASGSDLLWSSAQLAQRKIAVEQVTRGGKWTYHGPGQILIYPIVQLESLGYPNRGILRFLNDFRSLLVGYLSEHQIATDIDRKPFGIYSLKAEKLASFGVAVNRGICSHGVALYLKDQSAAFHGINPCGVTHQPVTHLEALGYSKDWATLAAEITDIVKRNFGIPNISK